MPDHEGDTWRGTSVRLVKGRADAAQGNELRMTLRKGSARRGYRGRYGDG